MFLSRISQKQEVTYIKRALFPVLTCHAAGRGDIVAMEELRKQVTIQSPHTQRGRLVAIC